MQIWYLPQSANFPGWIAAASRDCVVKSTCHQQQGCFSMVDDDNTVMTVRGKTANQDHKYTSAKKRSGDQAPNRLQPLPMLMPPPTRSSAMAMGNEGSV